jgi:hypothetical protein
MLALQAIRRRSGKSRVGNDKWVKFGHDGALVSDVWR